ncbi:MAG: ABC transporter permease [Magnetococcus sp. DMHC-6]
MIQKIATIAVFTALEGVRNRLIWVLGATLLSGIVLSSFSGSMAVTETPQIQLGVLSSFLRLSTVLLMTLFVLNSQAREYEDKGLELLLALPVPRSGYYFGKLFGFALLAVLVALCCSLTVALFQAPLTQTSLWGLSLFYELMLVIAFCMFAFIAFHQVPVAFMLVMAFYVLARSITTIQLIGHSPIMPSRDISLRFINQLIDFIAYLVPSLDQFTRAHWLIYGSGDGQALATVLGQGSIYLLLICSASLFDLYRKKI